MNIQFQDLNAENSGVDIHLKRAFADTVALFEEQEQGERKAGPVKVTLSVILERQGGGAIVNVESKVAGPARLIGGGRYASLTPDGRLQVDVAEQEPLPFDGVIRINKDSKE